MCVGGGGGGLLTRTKPSMFIYRHKLKFKKTYCLHKTRCSPDLIEVLICTFVFAYANIRFWALHRTFSKKDHFFGQKISKILCLAFDFICIYYMSSDY